MTSTNRNVGGIRKEVDYQKFGPALLILSVVLDGGLRVILICGSDWSAFLFLTVGCICLPTNEYWNCANAEMDAVYHRSEYTTATMGSEQRYLYLTDGCTCAVSIINSAAPVLPWTARSNAKLLLVDAASAEANGC